VELLARCIRTGCWCVGIESEFIHDDTTDHVGPGKRFIVTSSPHGVLALIGLLLGLPQLRLKKHNAVVAGACGVLHSICEGISYAQWCTRRHPQQRCALSHCCLPLSHCCLPLSHCCLPLSHAVLLSSNSPVYLTSWPTVAHLLKAGRSVALNPGGIHEQVMTDHRQEAIYCPPGLGFVRLAIQHGLPILPRYHFGENQVFTTYKIGLAARLWVATQCRVGLPIFTGRWDPVADSSSDESGACDWSAVGRPVDFGVKREPSDADVLEVYGRWCKELQRMFEYLSSTSTFSHQRWLQEGWKLFVENPRGSRNRKLVFLA